MKNHVIQSCAIVSCLNHQECCALMYLKSSGNSSFMQIPPHYILKRWTKEAKQGFTYVEDACDRQGITSSINMRYNNICQYFEVSR